MSEILSASSYYRATAGETGFAPLRGSIEAEICIIGGGFAGMGTAASLVERGRHGVALLESETIGHGASGRNGGFVFGGFSLGERSLVDSVGLEQGRQLYQMTLDAVEQIRRRIKDFAIDCDAVHGGIYWANWFDDDSILDTQQRFMRDTLGVEWKRVGREELRDKLDTSRYFGALYEENAFHFHPLKYAQGLARAIAARGVAVHERSRVTTLERHGAGWRVSTPEGTVHAREVVVCCGGYIEKLYPRLASAILPIATYVMVTEALGDKLATAMRTNAAVYDSRFAFDYYRPLQDTRILWGGRISIFDRSPQEVARLLYGDLMKVYPQLEGTRVEYAWSGMMSYGRHKMPQLGRLPEGLWYGMGFGGHGVGPTTLAGDVLAAAICGDGTKLERFGPWGLPTTGGPAGLLAAQLTYWYYELRDWLRQ